MSDARDRLLQAIKDCDAEVFGDREPDQVLTGYVVIHAHRQISGDPELDADQLGRLTMPGQAMWQTCGLLHSGVLYVEAELRDEEDQ